MPEWGPANSYGPILISQVEKLKLQTGNVTCPRSHSDLVTEQVCPPMLGSPGPGFEFPLWHQCTAHTGHGLLSRPSFPRG